MKFFVIIFLFLLGFFVNTLSYRIPRYDKYDGCARIHDEYVTTGTNFFDYEDVKDCYESFPFDNEIAFQTIETLNTLFDGFYSFLYKAKEPPPRGLDYRPMDLLVQLKLLLRKHYDTLFQFMKIKIFNDTIDPTNINCEVTHIDGRRTIKAISEFPSFISKDPGVRFNVAIDINYPGVTFFTRVDLPKTPSITYTLNCNNHVKCVKRNWKAIGIQEILDNFNNSETYFNNICKNSTLNYKLLSDKIIKIKDAHKNVYDIKSSKDITLLYEIVDFISFFKKQDFGVVKIMSENVPLNNTLAIEIIKGFQALVDTGVKKVVLDLSDNIGGFVVISNFINLLLFPNTKTFYDMDIRITKQLNPVLQDLVNVSEMVSAKNFKKFQYVGNLIGKNVLIRGGVKEHYSNRFILADPYDYKDLISQHLITPLPWKSADLIVLTNSLCGSSCALIAEGASEVNNVSTVAVGGFVNTPLSYASCQGGIAIDSTVIFNIISKLNLQNNTIMPKPFILGAKLNIPSSEFYSMKYSDKLLEYLYRPADFRLFYNEQSFRDRSILWSQAAALIGKNSKTYPG
ncbi:peptidase s41 family protein [Gigaspora margarita]|uniref:Peptidase s41 family protein n=1 Tax=Gigaspora margarita TaxID=4874 RepID=A0A8H4ACK6_GIGMA|nr:peptidase s41 family protein [Gigaspora margarita]